jgi:hypothetical protein
VYDGANRGAPVLKKFCGEHGHVTFFSTAEHLFIQFLTRAGRMGAVADPYDTNVDYKFSRRGFNVSFHFRKDIFKIGNFECTLHILWINNLCKLWELPANNMYCMGPVLQKVASPRISCTTLFTMYNHFANIYDLRLTRKFCPKSTTTWGRP